MSRRAFASGVSTAVITPVTIAIAMIAAAVVGPGVTSTAAAALSSFATLAVQGAIVPLTRAYRASTGHEVTIQFDTGPNIARRLREGQRSDVVIAPAAVIDQAIKDGRVIADSQAPVGKVGVGLAAGRGARPMPIGSVEELKAALLGADTVLYSQGTSGVYVEKLLADLGIMPGIAAKTTRLATGEQVLERIAAAPGTVLGFTMVSEIKMFADRGVVLVGPLPGPVQNLTTYVAAVMTGSSSPDAARGFVQFITTPDARRIFATTGWQE